MFTLQPEIDWKGGIASKGKRDPRPFLLPGIRMGFRPINDDMFEDCQQAMIAVLAETGNQVKALKAAQAVLLRAGIVAWEGIGDAAGKPLPVSPDAIEAVIRDPRLRAPAVAAYVTPFLLWDAEGNGSAGSLDTTGA